jgi:hypothetical protein
MSLERTTPILLSFVRGVTREGGEHLDPVDMGQVTHVPSKGDTVTLEGVVYVVSRVHFTADPSRPALHAVAHLAATSIPADEINHPRPVGL